MNTMPITRAAGIAALALVLWQCGGEEGTASASAARRVDACALAPKEEVEAIVGAAVTEVKGDFQEHTYVKPVNYTASCMYTVRPSSILLMVHYPYPKSGSTSEELASRITTNLRSDSEDDPDLKELYRNTEVRPVSGLAGPAAEYVMFDQTTIEARTGAYQVKVVAPSPESARGVAAKVLERLQ